jgi:REP element-mobilizing transposase RayT
MSDLPQTARYARRRNLRLQGYSYSTPGTYFVTICVAKRACIFGTVRDGEMLLNDVGAMVDQWWIETDRRFSDVETDAWVIMPNHVHVLIRIGWTDGSTLAERFPGRDTAQVRLLETDSEPAGMPGSDAGEPASLGRVIQWFKSATTTAYARGVSDDGWPRYPGRLWQPNYYEHIIRDEAELDRARAYILGNPGKWSEDQEYRPDCPGFAG